MAKDFSFDVVSDYDLAEVTNAVDQAQREIMTRYDFKGTGASLEFSDGKTGITMVCQSENQVKAILDVLQSKLIKRNVSLKVLDLSSAPQPSGMQFKWQIAFKKGLDQAKAKQVTTAIRAKYPKVKAQINGPEIRVSSTSKDDLQGVMQLLREVDFDFPLDFVNYR